MYFLRRLNLAVLMSVAAFAAFSRNLQAEAEINLAPEDLPGLVREKNQNVVGAALFRDAAEKRSGHLVRSFLPTLRLQGGAEGFQTGAYSKRTQPYGGAEINLNLFRGGRDSLEERVNDGQVVFSHASARKTYQEEVLEARKLYWQLVFNREMLQHLKASADKNTKHLDAANRRISRGLSTETDRLDFQIHGSQLREEIESLNHGYQLFEAELAAILAMPEGTRFKTDSKIAHVHDKALLEKQVSASEHPEVLALKAQQDIAAAQGSGLNRWWTPSIDAYAGHYLFTLRERDYFPQSLRYDTVVGVRLSIDLFDGLQSRSAASALSIQSAGYDLQAIQRRRTLQTGIYVAKEYLKHDHELIHFSEERIEQGRKYLLRVVDEYNRGVKNSIDVLSAAQRHLDFERQYAERRKNYQITKAKLSSLME